MNSTKWSDIAKRMASIGLLPIPTKKNKDSLIKWKDVSLGNITPEYYHSFDVNKCGGIAIVAGSKSGGLECLDIDSANDLTGMLYESIINAIVDYSPALYERLTIATTPSGGYHILYRTNLGRRNVKLARRLSTDEEIQEAVQERGREVLPFPVVLIETRGEGGYFLGWPSPGYNFIKGNYGTIMDITDKDAETIFEISRSFDLLPESKPVKEEISPRLGIDLGQTKEEIPDKVQKSINGRFIVTPWDDYNEKADVVTYLEQAGWRIVRTIPSPEDGRPVVYLKRPGVSDKDVSATFNHVPGKVFCFSTSTRLPDNKPLSPFEVFLYERHGNDLKAAIADLESQGYGVRKEKGPDDTIEEVARPLSTNSKAIEAAISRDLEQTRGETIEEWWRVNVKIKKSGEVEKVITVNQYELVSWLEGKGLRCKMDGDRPTWIRVDGCICTVITKKDIANLVVDYIGTLPNRFDFIRKGDLMEHFVKGIDVYLGDLKLSIVKHFDNSMLMRDDQEASYVAFGNGILKVSKHGESMVPYGKFHKLIWKDQIKTHKYSILDDKIKYDEIGSHPFNRFLFNICGRDMERLSHLKILLGYCMVTYKDPSVPAAIVFCDSKVSETSEGGTGKGILVKALSCIRNTVYEDGKMANKRNQSEFRFSRVTDATEILHLADVEKGFDFEAMFSLLTEGMPINRKYKAEEFIPYERSPKLVISTNYTVGGRGSSHNRRRVEFELSDHYGDRRTPFDDFGHHFFDGWDDDQWNVFYAIMSQCIKMYLQYGISKPVGINIELRKFRDETSGDFITWFMNKFGTREEVASTGPKTYGRYHFGTLYNEYLYYSGLERSETRPQRFKRFMASGCTYVGLEMEEICERRPQTHEYERFLMISAPGSEKIVVDEKLTANKSLNLP